MMTTISGTYENGQITFDEALPIKSHKAKVHVTFVEEIDEEPMKPTRTPGLMKGSFWIANDFNDPIDDLNEYM